MRRIVIIEGVHYDQKYPTRNEPGKTMVVFEKFRKFYGLKANPALIQEK